MCVLWTVFLSLSQLPNLCGIASACTTSACTTSQWSSACACPETPRAHAHHLRAHTHTTSLATLPHTHLPIQGLTAGGSMGLVEGLRSSAGERQRIRINAVLNATGKRGPTLGNGLGCLAMMVSVFESLAFTVRAPTPYPSHPTPPNPSSPPLIHPRPP